MEKTAQEEGIKIIPSNEEIDEINGLSYITDKVKKQLTELHKENGDLKNQIIAGLNLLKFSSSINASTIGTIGKIDVILPHKIKNNTIKEGYVKDDYVNWVCRGFFTLESIQIDDVYSLVGSIDIAEAAIIQYYDSNGKVYVYAELKDKEGKDCLVLPYLKHMTND